MCEACILASIGRRYCVVSMLPVGGMSVISLSHLRRIHMGATHHHAKGASMTASCLRKCELDSAGVDEIVRRSRLRKNAPKSTRESTRSQVTERHLQAYKDPLEQICKRNICFLLPPCYTSSSSSCSLFWEASLLYFHFHFLHNAANNLLTSR